MKVLAFESSTRVASVALIEEGQCVQIEDSHEQKAHSEMIHQLAQKILDQQHIDLSEVDVFAAGSGPGSFTGLRVALNTAKAFAYSFKKPLITVNSLLILAEANRAHLANSPETKVLTLINAFKNMSYFALYQAKDDGPLLTLSEPSAIPMKDIGTLLPEARVTVGDGFLAYERFLPDRIRQKLLRPSGLIDFPRADVLGRLATGLADSGQTLDWKSAKPLYIRSSEAEENKRGIVWTPLDFKE